MQLKEAKLWSPESPNLHHINVTLRSSEGEQTKSERFGLHLRIKEGESGGDNYYLNGERFTL